MAFQTRCANEPSHNLEIIRPQEVNVQPTVPKKMAAGHFPRIPCEPNTANRHTETHIFYKFLPCRNNIVYNRFEVFRTFLSVFMSVFRVFVRQELWVNIPVVIFFLRWVLSDVFNRVLIKRLFLESLRVSRFLTSTRRRRSQRLCFENGSRKLGYF